MPPRADSIQHAGLGTAFNSTGVAAGFFAGALDEARIWNYARSAAQIASGKTRPIQAAAGLIGRWGFNDSCGMIMDSVGTTNGTIFGSNWSWIAGAPFTNVPNAAPTVDGGPDLTIALPAPAQLNWLITDDDLSGTPLVSSWVKTSGPGPVTFGSPSVSPTSATFTTAGTYVLTLSANDGEFAVSDPVTVSVTGAINQAPQVNAGPNQNLTLPIASAALTGTVTDDGLPGTGVTTQWSKVSGPGTVTFGDAAALSTTAAFSTQGTYVLRLTANDGALSSNATLTITVDSNPANKAIDFAGTNAYVTFGAAPGLGASVFTVETWFRRDGAGVATFTGTGGVTAIPLVAKGMAEVEGSNKDMNYFLGIRQSDGVLAADFEDMATGLNHPVAGVTAIPANGAWHHAAATYDGTTWRLYLDGVARRAARRRRLHAAVRQHPARRDWHGAELDRRGDQRPAQGFFDGVVDEARVWNYARTIGQISRGKNFEIANAPGLLGRWSFNAGTGTVLADSTGHGINGTVTGAGFAWVAGVPFPTQGNTAPTAVADTATTD